MDANRATIQRGHQMLQSKPGARSRRQVAAVALLLLLLGASGPAPLSRSGAAAASGVVLHEERSPYSLVRVREQDERRMLIFVQANGEEVVETTMDLRAPHRLHHPYGRTMVAAALVYRPAPSNILLAGLGGGALVKFLERYFPEPKLDIVEIDPVVVRVAGQFFGVGSGGRTRVFVADAFELVRSARERYDVVLMDAFLTPGSGTDGTGVPLRLKSTTFLRSLRERLAENGVAVFNLHHSPRTSDDISAIREVFPHGVVFDVPGSGNVIALGTAAPALPGAADLRERARRLDRGADHGFSFERLLRDRREGW
jgi:spermidine synthase